ncbi:N-terminal glutamine amidase-domain-containing protein [Chiua virens]|nr:N-terminal glutamine amidase-domain-containing protein [Chiua virens]
MIRCFRSWQTRLIVASGSDLTSGVGICFMESASTLPDYSNSVYTSGYCEENIYWLVKRFSAPSGGEKRWDAFAVFISNPAETVALWNQRMCASKDKPMVWDYHVVLALCEPQQVHSQSVSRFPERADSGIWIYDLDTCLPLPCHSKVYIDQTFPLGTGIPLQYQSFFRVVPGEVYLANFASDRSHMLQVSGLNSSEGPRYLVEPPPYPAICGTEAEKHGVGHNLMTHFVSVVGDQQGFGRVMDFDTFKTWCSFSGPASGKEAWGGM